MNMPSSISEHIHWEHAFINSFKHSKKQLEEKGQEQHGGKENCLILIPLLRVAATQRLLTVL